MQPDTETTLLTLSPASHCPLPLTVPSSAVSSILNVVAFSSVSQDAPLSTLGVRFSHMSMLLLSTRFLSCLSPYPWTELGVKQI